MESPLIIHGPSKAYATSYYGVGDDIVAINATCGESPVMPPTMHFYPKSERTFFQRLIGMFRRYNSHSAIAAEVLELCRKYKWGQDSQSHCFRTLITRIPSHHSTRRLYVNQLTLFRSSIRAQQKELLNESNSKTTRSNRSYPTVEVRKRSISNNARDCSRIRSEQSHDIRTHRGTHTKGSSQQRAKQSSLFIDC